MNPTLRITLKPGRDKSLRRGHPWLFSGAVARVEGDPESPVAQVQTAGGEVLGSGFFSPRSQIRVRLAAAAGEDLDASFFEGRLAAARALRRDLVPAETTGYRLVNAEGDGLPGWTVDRFGDVLVSQITSAGLEGLRDVAYDALGRSLPEVRDGGTVVQSNALPARKNEGLGTADETIWGEAPETVEFRENGLAFTAELAGGQKTGFYCDQRSNRRLTETLAGGRRILDLFAHTGGFGLYALRGGAERVVHVESSPRVLERGKAHYALNADVPGIDAGRAEWVRADVFADLRQREELYDLVICDPPPLVRRRSALDAGARAYKDLNRLALSRLAPGGLLLTFCCSGAVDTKLFRQILFAAADEARVQLALLAPLAAAPDHPVSVFHPEGEYLKGWLCHRAGDRGSTRGEG
ncbi:MAG: class I SAM-dependent rRNA methyltransferase [Acidobacteria bacterium]|nr:class I SAM-dependent rRNA methyltransferase [Acidobacteriota bacterium]